MKILGKTTVDQEFEDIYFSEILAITAGIIGGIFLAKLSDNIGLTAGLFILLPGLLEMQGNIYGSLSARVSNLLLIGKLNDKKEIRYHIRQNVLASLFLILFISFVLGLISYLFIYFFSGLHNPKIIFISVLSSFLSSVLEIPFTIYMAFWLYKHKFDPEDIMGPYVTTLADTISIISLVIVAGVFI